MILLLRHFYDPVCDVLAHLLGQDVRQIQIETWLNNLKISHRVGAADSMAVFFDKRGNSVLDKDVGVVFNRVHSMRLAMPQNTDPADMNYFSSEAAALLWSCLESLQCRVINSCRSVGLVGHGVRPVEVLALAVKCGILPCGHLFTTRRQSVRGMVPFEGALITVGPGDSGNGLFKRRGEGISKTIWVTAGLLKGDLEGLSENAINRFVGEAELGFASLSFDAYPDGSWHLSAVDRFPATAPDHAIADLANQLDFLNRTNAKLEAAQ